MIQRLGQTVLDQGLSIVYLAAVLGAALALAVRPSSWTVPVRTVLLRQLIFTAFDAIPVCMRFASAAGILLIVQTAIWIDTIGVTTDILAPTLWRAIIRELAPLLACLVVIGRSGIAMATELATMKIGGELDVLDASGMDPMICLVMPRILAVIASVFGLALLMTLTMISTGYVVGYVMDAIRISPSMFIEQLVRNFEPLDLVFFVPKTLLAAGFAGAVCCVDGLSVQNSITDVPRVSSKAGMHALTSVVIVSATLSVLIYGRLLVFNIF